jgi:predicted RNase H-like HicB family nuclease
MKRTSDETQAKVQQQAMATRQRERRADDQVSHARTANQRGRAALPPYAMRLDWDPDDRIFVATVPELPGCRTHGRTRAEAVRNGEEAIAAWLGGAQRFGDPLPAPAVVQFESGLAEGEADGPF